ncbi:hypothetical protein [Nesterenkonia alba]|uniref:hypothetical protein n=1 Tax=Nesterenkonia alba TaxID=515814 RepID=UPI0012EC85D0|nr:hypothetical protein [Nesterenkonia alba]
MHGTHDTRVPLEYSIRANEAYENSELFVIGGAGHGFGGANARSTLKTIHYFVDSE